MKRSLVFGFVSLTLLFLGYLAWAQTNSPQMPPGVPSKMWIPLAENAGIVFKENRTLTAEKNVLRGTLMIKALGIWQEVYLEPGPSRIFPAK